MSKKRILILEDQPEIMRIFTRVLSKLGVEITHYTAAETAVFDIQSQGWSFDIILCDENLDGKMTGTDFKNWLKVNRPDLAANFISTTNDPRAALTHTRHIEKMDIRAIEEAAKS